MGIKKNTPNGKAPHDTSRPTPAYVQKAVDEGDAETVASRLTPRQRAFCREYIVDFNASEAARRAGYAHSYADRQAYLLMMNSGVRFLIDHLNTSKAAKIVSVDPDYVLTKIKAVVEKKGARDGDVLRGLELLARHLGMLRDKTEISGPDGAPIQHEQTEAEARDFTNQLKRMANLTVINGGKSSTSDE